MSDAITRINQMMQDTTQDYLASTRGTARQATWYCEDGWVVRYTTTRVKGGKHGGSFVAQLFRPSRRGEPGDLIQDDRRVCATRAEAKARAEKWYWEHCPKRNAKRARWFAPTA